MKVWMLAVMLAPMARFFVFACVCLPIRWAIWRWFPAGKVKDSILKIRGFRAAQERP